MNSVEIQFLTNLVYGEESESLVEEIKKMRNPLFLHVIAANYNWNNGFEVPHALAANPNCDFGTGLLLFYHADGYRLLESPDAVFESPLKDWKKFLVYIHEKIVEGDFSTRNISFTPPLTKMQIFKLKKGHPNVPDVILSKSPGDEVQIPQL